MKLIIVILRDKDTENVSRALVTNNYRVTRVASTGGFLKRGSTTLLIGLEDEAVENALSIIKTSLLPETEVGIKRAVMFVLDVDQFTQF